MPLFSKKSPSSADVSSISPSETETLTQDTEAMQRFTATGRPIPTYTPSSLANLPADFCPTAPQHLPMKFTDDSILTIPIPLSALHPPSSSPDHVVTTTTTGAPTSNNNERRSSSLLGKLTGGKEKKAGKGGEGFRMVQMTRREYLMYWAKDEGGRYVGSEPEGEGARRLREREREEEGEKV